MIEFCVMPRYVDFFSKDYAYVGTEKSNWNLDDGYALYLNDSMPVDVIPFRTGGNSYYHRLRLVMHSLDDKFLSCSNRYLVSGFVVRKKYILCLLYKICI